VLGTDPLSDLAVLEIKAEGLSAVKWGNSDTVDKGDIVLAFGAPFGYVGSMTQGIVSGKNRTTAPFGGPGLLGTGAYEYFIQTDCAINPGNSGGPLVNVHGELVGINTAIASTTGGFNGIGFAVPSNLARFVYDQLKSEGKVTRGFLGVGIRTVSELPKGQLDRLNLDKRKGVYVGEVKNDSPAAGKLEVNDVILSVNGEAVTTREELRLKVAFAKPGSEVKLAVVRDGKEKVVPVSVGTFPDQSQANATKKAQPAAPVPNEMGATFADASSARLKSAGLPSGSKGALVAGIKTNSPAQLAGLLAGDLVTKVNDTEVTNAEEANTAIKAASLKEGISLSVIDKEGTKSVFVQVEE
jgi:serine protease Do